MDDHHNLLIQKSNRDPSIFTLIPSVVFKGKRRAIKDFSRTRKIQTTLF